MASRSEHLKLVISVTYFELVQLICSAYINVRDRQTDRQTDGRLTIAIPRFALRASRGKKTQSAVEVTSAVKMAWLQVANVCQIRPVTGYDTVVLIYTL